MQRTYHLKMPKLCILFNGVLCDSSACHMKTTWCTLNPSHCFKLE